MKRKEESGLPYPTQPNFLVFGVYNNTQYATREMGTISELPLIGITNVRFRVMARVRVRVRVQVFLQVIQKVGNSDTISGNSDKW